MRLLQLTTACAAVLVVAGGQVDAGIITFDAESDLTNNFLLDIFPGDNLTQWRNGYGPSGGFPGSDGGFVLFNDFDTSNSIAFLSGPVFLNRFDISSQWSAGGAGVGFAADAQRDYHLRLYNQSLVPILDTTLQVAENGAWTTETFNVPNVYAIWIDRRDNDGTGTLVGGR